MSPKPSASEIREINDSIRYAMWSVFKVTSPLPEDRAKVAAEVEALFADVTEQGVVVRGVYDVAGLRADADFMVWWHAEDVRTVQTAYHRLRRTELGAHLEPVWSVAALHRPAEFNKGHIPFEADDLTRIVDLMRHLRGSETRRHVREEVPFYTGPRVEVAALVDSLP